MRVGLVSAVVLAIALIVSCEDSGTGPPDLTPSVLSLAFTGDSSKVGMSDGSGSLPQAALSFSACETSNGVKGSCEVTASWTLCPESSFNSYVLYRSETSDISSSPSSAQVLGVFTDPNTSLYIDDDIDWATKYYYALRTNDENDNSVWSNEAQIVTPDSSGGGGTLPEGMEFVSIPSGSFEMGAPAGEVGSSSSERPVHTVTFNYDFEMMTTEVTQEMWEEVMGSNPSYFSGVSLPVETVSWDDCQDFVNAMNDLDPDHEYRLPSEAEREYCCRAGTTARYYWGDDPSYTLIDEYAWYSYNSGSETHPVAQKLPNAWGLHDMSGNVFEWCEDYWHDGYSGAPTDGSAWLSPASPYRVVRGGGWDSPPMNCRSAYRDDFGPGSSSTAVGLRLVRSAR